jgi:tRNA(fMet)-specific endonuclease VapC
MQNHEKVEAKPEDVADAEEPVFMSGINHYEIKRGLLAVNATRKMKIYDAIRQDFQMLFLNNEEVFEKAAEIHADLKRRGKLIQDADIFIATTALLQNLILVTNDLHFQWISDLTTENWIADSN